MQHASGGNARTQPRVHPPGTQRNARMAPRPSPRHIAFHERHPSHRPAAGRASLAAGPRPPARRLPVCRHHHGRVLPPRLPFAPPAAQERPLLPQPAGSRGRRLPRLQALRPQGGARRHRPGRGTRCLHQHRGVGRHPLARCAGHSRRLLALPFPAAVSRPHRAHPPRLRRGCACPQTGRVLGRGHAGGRRSGRRRLRLRIPRL